MLSLRYEPCGITTANSPIIGHTGVGLLALSLRDAYPPERSAVIGEVFRSAVAYARAGLENTIAPDGAPREGIPYGSASLYYIAVFAEALRRASRLNLFRRPVWKGYVRYLASELLAGEGRSITSTTVGTAQVSITSRFWRSESTTPSPSGSGAGTTERRVATERPSYFFSMLSAEERYAQSS